MIRPNQILNILPFGIIVTILLIGDHLILCFSLSNVVGFYLNLINNLSDCCCEVACG